MMRNHQVIQVAAIALFCVSACGFCMAQERKTLKESCVYPTEIGTTWVYRTGDKKDTYSTMSSSVKSDSIVIIIGKLIGDKYVPDHQMEYSDDGLYRTNLTVEMPKDVDGKPMKDARYKLLTKLGKAGDSWQYEYSSVGIALEEKGKMLISEKEKVEVPAGKYEAVKVEATIWVVDSLLSYRPLVTTRWFAPGVGLVKQVDWEGNVTVLESINRKK